MHKEESNLFDKRKKTNVFSVMGKGVGGRIAVKMKLWHYGRVT